MNEAKVEQDAPKTNNDDNENPKKKNAKNEGSTNLLTKMKNLFRRKSNYIKENPKNDSVHYSVTSPRPQF